MGLITTRDRQAIVIMVVVFLLGAAALWWIATWWFITVPVVLAILGLMLWGLLRSVRREREAQQAAISHAAEIERDRGFVQLATAVKEIVDTQTVSRPALITRLTVSPSRLDDMLATLAAMGIIERTETNGWRVLWGQRELERWVAA